MERKGRLHFDQQIRQVQGSPSEQNLHPKTVKSTSCDSKPIIDGWARIAESLMPKVMQVLNAALADAITAGVRTDDEVAAIVCRHSSRWPVPDEYLSCVEAFIISYCTKASRPDKETQKFLKDTGSTIRRSPRFLVFHHGRNHYYNELPEDVLKLRETALFWIYEATNDFCSRGRQRKRLGPQTLRLLRFICDEKNAGRTVTLAELYRHVWLKEPASVEKMVGSIEVEMSKLNTFAFRKFEHRTEKNAIVTRVCDSYKISKEASNECCIISTCTQHREVNKTFY